MAQNDTQSTVSALRRLSIVSTLSPSSSVSSVSSRNGQVSDSPVASTPVSNAFEKPTNVAKIEKWNSNVMKAGYSKVKKSTSSMFKTKSRRSSVSSLSDKDQPISLSELDARLQILERAEPSTADSEGSSYPLPIPETRNKTPLTPHFTTPRREGTPCLWLVPEQDDQMTSPEVQHPKPKSLLNNTGADRLLIYLVAALIAIPNVALSWAPMSVSIVVVSAIAVLYGYRLAVAFPVFMLLNPTSPIWRESGARRGGRDVLVSSSHQARASRHRKYPSRQPSPPRSRPIVSARRHSTL